VNFQSFFKRIASAAFAVASVFVISSAAQQAKPMPRATPTMVIKESRPLAVAERNNVYCAGYVQMAPVDTSTSLVGGHNEQDQFLYSENNFVYINAGENKGVKVGDTMAVIRPRGTVKSRLTKKGELGFYVEEVGMVEVVRVKLDVSVARVKTSCTDMMLGDLVQPAQVRTAPVANQRPALDLFGDPSGKAMGRLFMARDKKELLGREEIVYVDLGEDDNVKVGDYLTIFRPLGKGNLFKNDVAYHSDARVADYQSDKFRGGKFSSQAARKSGEHARGSVVTVEGAKEGRPNNLRKVVGEAVILNVKERTATAVITRTAQEIQAGDWVEVQ
jgi:hypothetical protein